MLYITAISTWNNSVLVQQNNTSVYENFAESPLTPDLRNKQQMPSEEKWQEKIKSQMKFCYYSSSLMMLDGETEALKRN